MLAFMGAQSYLMMYMAGAGWQFGKRKISAMSNETFNPITVTSLYKQMTTELKESIPTIEKSMNDMTSLLAPIIEQYGDFIREALKALPATLEKAIDPTSLVGQVTAEPDAWAQLVKFLAMLSGQLNALPAAEGRLGAGTLGATIETLDQTSTAEDRLKKHLEAIAQANKEKEAQKLKDKFLVNIDTVHETATQEHKPKAGQTQIIQRNGLVKYIGQIAIIIKNTKALLKRFPDRASTYTRQIIRDEKNLKSAQTQLTGLLGRYRW